MITTLIILLIATMIAPDLVAGWLNRHWNFIQGALVVTGTLLLMMAAVSLALNLPGICAELSRIPAQFK